ncbi:aromatic ring-hydroxylating dioxygenase subunit alpha [Hydrogenophaga sp. 5NK40-0174]|uniref:aromatic ring-hydroxylating dioxygenase subunit alpha n=1 Tax=Hydrogenophaga sp. 5NK40-0174 TaxID=3127649 RepID=UPI0031024A66
MNSPRPEAPLNFFPKEPEWEGDGEGSGTHRIPFAAYTSEELHKKELERFFYKGHWCYVGLEAEVPKPGDFKRTVVGERSVIMVRDRDGSINVVENVCAHRGMRFCRERHGNKRNFVCPYHQWGYKLNGDLVGVPFRNGVKQDGQMHGGMPEDFNMADHGLTKLKVAVRGGVVFASFDENVEPFEDYLGPTILQYFDRMFNGRKLTILGYNRQRIPGNWKLMQENIKDPYHPGLLHTWFVTFGLWRADNKSQLRMDDKHRHAAMISTRGNAGKVSEVSQVTSFKQSMKLNDASFLDIVPEDWWAMQGSPAAQGRPEAPDAPSGGSDRHEVPSVGASNPMPTAVMTTIFPSVILQQQVNSVSTRHIQPNGNGSFDFVWTHFGYEDDTEEMTNRRLTQANLFGPAGFVSADDGEVIEFSQEGFESKPFHRAVAELGGKEVENTEHMVTETLIRGMYRYWREVMEADKDD